jgi:hypothetical protein
MASSKRAFEVEYESLEARVESLRMTHTDGEDRILVDTLAEVLRRFTRIGSSKRAPASGERMSEPPAHWKVAAATKPCGGACDIKEAGVVERSVGLLDSPKFSDEDKDAVLDLKYWDHICGTTDMIPVLCHEPLNDGSDGKPKRVFRKTPIRANPSAQPASGGLSDCRQFCEEASQDSPMSGDISKILRDSVPRLSSKEEILKWLEASSQGADRERAQRGRGPLLFP